MVIVVDVFPDDEVCPDELEDDDFCPDELEDDDFCPDELELASDPDLLTEIVLFT